MNLDVIYVKMSTKGRYALTTMMYLANHYSDEKYVSLKEISDSEGISFKYLEKIVNNLNKNNYLDVQRGNNGGYKLKKKPEEYVIGDILRVSEGNLAPIELRKMIVKCVIFGRDYMIRLIIMLIVLH